MSATKTEIDLYTAGTPNGHKVHILLEELGLNYNVHHIQLSKNEQKQDWYLKINPNGRIPAMLDRTGGKDIRTFEGLAMMLYLCEKYDQQHKMWFAYGSDEYWEMINWSVFLQSGIGPMQGQANHFYRYAPHKDEYAINRYQTETKRLYQVIETHLAEQEKAGKGLWIVGGRYSIADLANFSWINWAEWAGIDTSPYPKLQEWLAEINKRDATQRGVNIPEPFHMKEAMKNKEKEKEYADANSRWVMKGQEADQQKHK